MKLPNAVQAIVPAVKIRDYLLSLSHPDGRHKAAFFVRFGYSSDEWQVLADNMRQHALDNDVSFAEESVYGIRYAVDGVLFSPDGRNPIVRVIWFIEVGDSIPRLVTAYPAPR